MRGPFWAVARRGRANDGSREWLQAAPPLARRRWRRLRRPGWSTAVASSMEALPSMSVEDC